MSIYAAQLQTFNLAGSGAVIGATSITLKSFRTIDGVQLDMTSFGTKGFMTIDAGNNTQEEQISFTGITLNSNGTTTLTGIKSVAFVTPFSETTGLLKTHAGSAEVIVSNTSGFYNTLFSSVSSVNGQTGTVVLDTSNISDTTNKRYVTDAQQTVLTNISGTNTGDNATNSQYFTASATTTLTNKRVTQRVLALSANSATPAINTDSYDVVHITSQTTAITSFTTNLTGTPVDGDRLRISITGTTSVAITWGASFEASTVSLPTTTSSTTRLDVGFFWNTETNKWRCVASV